MLCLVAAIGGDVIAPDSPAESAAVQEIKGLSHDPIVLSQMALVKGEVVAAKADELARNGKFADAITALKVGKALIALGSRILERWSS